MIRNKLAFRISLTALVFSIWVWGDLFVFSKTKHYPAWQDNLPPWMGGTTLMVLIPLVPAFFLALSTKDFVKTIGLALLIAPWPAMIHHTPMHLGPEYGWSTDISNLLFNYLLTFIQCFVPAVFLVLAKFCTQWLVSKLRG